MQHICEHCNQTFESNRSNARFCCNAHKQAAYRSRVKAESERPDTFGNRIADTRTPVEKAVDTKRNEQRLKTCPHCWNSFPVNGLQKGRRYCSDACKQAAYRERNKRQSWHRESETKHTPMETIRASDNIAEIVKDAWSELVED
jgi:hypothetical protein